LCHREASERAAGRLYESPTDYNSDRPFQPVTLQGALFADSVPLYREANLLKTPAQGNQLVEVMGEKRAVFMRGHGAVVVGLDLEELLFYALVLEDDACKTEQVTTLGKRWHDQS